MSELTLASRPASTAGIEGITSQYEADRAATKREKRVAAFDDMVDALLREKQENNASESDLLSQSSTTESKRHMPQQAEFDSHYLAGLPMRIVVRDSGDDRREITLQPILSEGENETTLANSKQVFFTAPDKAVTGVQCEYFPPHKPGQKVETTGVRDASNRELKSLECILAAAELRGSKPASR